MPLSMPPDSPPIPSDHARYPATTKQAAAIIDGVLTIAASTLFTDKIMITITQDGRLAQWVFQRSVNYPNHLVYTKSCKSLDPCRPRYIQSQLCRSTSPIGCKWRQSSPVIPSNAPYIARRFYFRAWDSGSTLRNADRQFDPYEESRRKENGAARSGIEESWSK